MRKHAKLPPFVALTRKTLRGQEWRQLSPPAKIVYIHIKYKFVGNNNGDICLHYSELRDMFAPGTIAKALKELYKKEWVERTKYGGLHRYDNRFFLTGKYDDALINYKL